MLTFLHNTEKSQYSHFSKILHEYTANKSTKSAHLVFVHIGALMLLLLNDDHRGLQMSVYRHIKTHKRALLQN